MRKGAPPPPSGGKWDKDDVENLICNPIYAGIDPHPPMIPEDQWVAAATNALKQMGPEKFLKTMLHGLREAYRGAVVRSD